MFLSFARRRLAIRFVSALSLVIVGVGIDRFVLAQQTGIKRTILLTTDEPGSNTHEAVMGVAEVAPGASSGRHRHPGIEIGYVLEGSVRVEHDGRAAIVLKPGDVFRNDGVHNVTSTGTLPAKILAVYLVEKGKPLVEAVR
jgi:quercetin dioxygenase-like cupin family protein